MTAKEKRRLEQVACKVRMNALQAVHTARNGDLHAFLSSADLLTFLYSREMNVDSCNPQKADRLVLTGGHYVPCLCAVLENLESCPKEQVPTLRSFRECPGKGNAYGLCAGSLSIATGMALAARYQERDCRVYALLRGEEAAAEAWEIFLLARHHRLDGLCVIIEQSVPRTSGGTGGGPLPEVLRVLGFQVIETDGHDFASLESAFAKARECKGAPTVLLVRTVPGKDIRFLENSQHGGALDGREYEQAMAELNAHLAELEAG